MRKICLFLFLFCAVVLISSCSQDEILKSDVGENPITEQEMSNDVVIMPADGQEPDSEIQKRVKENSEKYQFGNSNSELWKESMLRTSLLSVNGYDIREEVKRTKAMYP